MEARERPKTTEFKDLRLKIQKIIHILIILL